MPRPPRQRPAARYVVIALVGSLASLLPLGTAFAAAPGPSAASPGGHHPLDTSLPAASEPAWVHLHHPNGTNPGPRSSAALASDPSGAGAVLFGGCSVGRCPANDTWRFAANSWVNATASSGAAPSPRDGAAFVLDSSTGGDLLFGGCAAGGLPLGDTWLFGPNGWSAVTPTGTVPPPLCGAAAATAPGRAGVYLFGGHGPNGSVDGALWQYRSGSWSSLPVSGPSPAPRTNASMAVDPSSNTLVLFGGSAANGTTLGDTWSFNGSGWTRVPSAGGPSARENAGLLAIPSLGGLLLFGGDVAGVPLGDSWLLEHGSWSNVSGRFAHPPAARTDAAFAFDTADGYALMVGGRTGADQLRNDTWALVLPMAGSVTLPAGPVAPGDAVQLSTAVAGGLPPYHYNWSFGSVAPSIRQVAPYVTFPATGVYPVNVSVTDNRGVSLNLSASVEVAIPPLGAGLSLASPRVSVGQSVEVTVQAIGGTPPYAVRFVGLPPGCADNGSLRFSCTPTADGDFVLTATVTDRAGHEANASSALVVGPMPVAAVAAGPSAGAQAFDRWGWVLVPPLAAAVAMAAYAALASAGSAPVALAAPPNRPDCYVPPEWSETPPRFDPAASGSPDDPSSLRR